MNKLGFQHSKFQSVLFGDKNTKKPDKPFIYTLDKSKLNDGGALMRAFGEEEDTLSLKSKIKVIRLNTRQTSQTSN